VQTRASHVLRSHRNCIGPFRWVLQGALLLSMSLQTVDLARAQEPAATAKCPPVARIDSAKDTYGSTVVADPYRWLEDQSSAETRAWIAAEQKCTEGALSRLPSRAAVTKRLTELFHTDSFEAPLERGGRYFFRKRLAGQDLFQIFMRRSVNAADELLVDPLPWSADHSASATLLNVSKDGKLIFYGRREGGQDEVTVHIMDVGARHDVADVLPAARYDSLEPTPDKKKIYYTVFTEKGPRAYYHDMGSDSAKDKLIFGEELDKQKILVLGLSEDGRYLVYLVVVLGGKTEVYVQDLKGTGPVVTVVNDLPSAFHPFLAGDKLYLRTNWKAPHWRVYSAALSAPQREHWQEVIPETDATLESLSPIGGKIAALYTRNATSELKLFDADGKNSKTIPLPTLGSVSSVAGLWENAEAFYTFETYSVPQTIYRYQVPTGTSTVWAEAKAPFDRSQFELEQVWYESKDGTRVPMFLFHKKGLKRDGANPVILTGYGGFNLTRSPLYFAPYLLWAERSGIVAMPNLRGGGEFGEDWHRAGMLGKKQNVFDDFIAAAEYLIANKYTSVGKLSIRGGSNGGLLVGAAMAQRPELFRAVVCLYPLLDMLRFQKFLVAQTWVPEYGSADNPEQFAYLYAYSPYQHVMKDVKYPSALFVTGDGDTRVAPLHARKMAALLQASTGSDRPILLLYDTKSGHSGGRPMHKQIQEETDVLSYLFWQLDMDSGARD
jgi:prolyl oligopeptidase